MLLMMISLHMLPHKGISPTLPSIWLIALQVSVRTALPASVASILSPKVSNCWSGGNSDVHQHRFFWNGTYWVCIGCFTKTSDPLLRSSSRAFCSGKSFFDDLLGHPRGHSLWGTRGAGGTPLIYCSRCWHYAESFPRSLKFKCKGGDSTVRPSVKFYLSKGRHPISRRVLSRPTRLV